MIRLLCTAGLVAGALGRAVQHPLAAESSTQNAQGIEHVESTESVQGGQHWWPKPLVNSRLLQHRIHSGNLLKRAHKLFDIAHASVEEYNHPTRVIGSAGKYQNEETHQAY